MDELKTCVESSELPARIADYLYYEYKAELYVLSYNAVKGGIATQSEDCLPLFNYLWERLSRLGSVDTIDADMPRHLEQLLSMDPEEAEQALRISMNAVKWNVIAGSSENPHAIKKQQKAIDDYYTTARHVLNKARQNKNPLKQMRAARYRRRPSTKKYAWSI